MMVTDVRPLRNRVCHSLVWCNETMKRDNEPEVVLALDVDGVLLDPDRGGRGSWQQELQPRFGIHPDRLFEAFFAPSWQAILTGDLSIEPTLARALCSIGFDGSVEAILDCWFESDFYVVEEVASAVRDWALQGVRVVFATNQEHRRAAYLWENLRQHVPVNSIMYSADIGYTKDDPRFFSAVEERLGIESRHVVLVDDIVENVFQARQSGWSGVHFAGQVTWRSEIQRCLDIVRDEPQ